VYRVAFLLVLLWSGALAAQEDAPPLTSTADEIFEAGVRALERQDWVAAEVLFRQAYEIEPSARVRLNLGQSLYEQDELEAARVEAAAVVHGDDLLLQEAAQVLLDQIDAALAGLTLVAQGVPPDDVGLRLDGEEVPGGEVLHVNPGEHRVALFDDDRLVAEETVTLRRGETKELRIGPDLSPEGVAAAEGGEETPQLLGGEAARRKRRRRIGLGIAAAVLIVGAVALGLGLGLRDNDSPTGDVDALVFDLGSR
tara:strand:- start:428 stop:1189 length:762 start_codon:yes stop_codon:yes gene_type:complete